MFIVLPPIDETNPEIGQVALRFQIIPATTMYRPCHPMSTALQDSQKEVTYTTDEVRNAASQFAVIQTYLVDRVQNRDTDKRAQAFQRGDEGEKAARDTAQRQLRGEGED